jgi:two-component system, sensor histidine kinase LadS
MKKLLLIFIFCIQLLSFTNANEIAMEIYQLNDETKQLKVEQVIESSHFFKIQDKSVLNFGISKSNFWLKISVRNTVIDATYKVLLATIVPDTIEIYQFEKGILKKELIGEGIPSKERFLNYYFKPTGEETILYFKITGDGQPIALPISIVRSDIGDDIGISSILFSGLLYGIVCLILIINIVLYIGTPEKLYLYFFIFNVFWIAVVMYFDGFVKCLIFPNGSTYWNNQFVAIALCGSFITANYYFQEFLKIKVHQPGLTKYFNAINAVFWIILIISFWHPSGFNFYIKSNIIITSAEAILLFRSIFVVRHKEKEYFLAQMISVGLVVVFGTILQLYFFGLLPINTITRYAVHGMILPQIFIQTFVLGKRFTILAKERLELQTTLLKSSEQYSQSLISTLENERQRLSSEFHDSIGQNLLVIRNRILLMLKQNYTTIQKEKLNGLAMITSETLDEIRIISQDLRPTTLDTIGLTASLNNMVERLKRSTEIQIEYNCLQNIDEIIAKDLEINIYRILQELTNNILKHSKASIATVTITQQSQLLFLQIKDNGIGFDTQKITMTNAGNGFSSINERVKILKGSMQIISEIEKGTIFNIEIPTL